MSRQISNVTTLLPIPQLRNRRDDFPPRPSVLASVARRHLTQPTTWRLNLRREWSTSRHFDRPCHRNHPECNCRIVGSEFFRFQTTINVKRAARQPDRSTYNAKRTTKFGCLRHRQDTAPLSRSV